METTSLTSTDLELFDRARDELDRHYDASDHQVAAAIRGQSGAIYCGLHLGSRRINICAEWSALAAAVMADDTPATDAVAVCRAADGRIVVTNPCGLCRELMGRYAPHASVLIDSNTGIRKVRIEELLPHPWLLADENPWVTQDPKIGA